MDRFFTLLGRVNQVLLFLLLLGLGLGALGVLAMNLLDRPRRGGDIVAATADPAGREATVELHLDRLETIAGSDVQMLHLVAQVDGSKLTSGAGYRETRNLLFFAGDGTAARWLFPRHGQLIMRASQLGDDDRPRGRDGPTRALLLAYVAQDSDGDGRLTERDLATLALVRPDGTGLVELAQGVSRLLSHQPIGERQLGLVYRTGRQVRYARYALDSFAKLAEQVVVEAPERL